MEIANPKDATCIALLFQKPRNATWRKVRSELKKRLLEHAEKLDGNLQSNPLFAIDMPYGEKAIYKTFEDIPKHDIPCPCGNKNHWLVKWVSID